MFRWALPRAVSLKAWEYAFSVWGNAPAAFLRLLFRRQYGNMFRGAPAALEKHAEMRERCRFTLLSSAVPFLGGHHETWLVAIVTLFALVQLVQSRFAEKRFKEDGEKYRALIEKGSDGIVIVQDGRITFVNQKILEMTGFYRHEVIGHAFAKFIPEAQRDAVLERNRRRMAGEAVAERYELALPTRAGEELLTELSVSVVDYRGKTAAMVIIRDISERAQYERELKRLASFPELDPNPVVEIDQQRKLTYLNFAAQKFFPDLKEKGIQHPFLSDIEFLMNIVLHDEKRSLVREVKVGGSWFQQELYYVGRTSSFRVYGYDIGCRKHMEESLKQSEEKYRTLFETMLQGVMYEDAQGNIISANPAAKNILGLTHAQIVAGTDYHEPRCRTIREDGSDFPEYLHPSKVALRSGSEVKNVVMGVFNPQLGEYRWLNINAVPQFRSGEDKPWQVYTIIDDITERKRAENQLKDSETRYHSLFESMRDGILILDAASGAIIDANPAMVALSGRTYPELLERKFSDIPLFRDPEATAAAFLELQNKEFVRYDNLVLEKKNGKTVEVEFTSAIYYVGRKKVIQCNIRDITERRQAERQITYLSFHDRVTGLYNRTYFEEELRRLDTRRTLPISIIMGDVNNLKLVNDAFGHKEGDKLLIKIASILKSSCRNEDIVARWGGDEFIILLPRTDERTALDIVKRVRKDCSDAKAKPVRPTIALGVATKEATAHDIHEILKEAEDRMYRNKLMESKSGRNAIISSLIKTLRARSHETGQHAQRLRKLVTEIGAAINLSDSQIDELALLSVLHDIGKIAIPDDILMKPGPLTSKEWCTMLKHSEVGYRIAQSFNALAHIADAILAHHERWDGSGYPQGLKSEEIPLISRILAIVDAYDVMTHGRPYKRPMSSQQALEELKKNAGSQFDPELVSVFARRIEKPVMADMNEGRTGVIAAS